MRYHRNDIGTPRPPSEKKKFARRRVRETFRTGPHAHDNNNRQPTTADERVLSAGPVKNR